MFFLPAASHVEKEGTFTQTQRLLQWREKAVEPPGDCRSELWFFYHLGRMIRERLADSTAAARPSAARPGLGLPRRTVRRGPERRGGAAGDQRVRRGHRPAAVDLHRDEGRRLDPRRLLDLHRRLRRRRQPGRPAQAAARSSHWVAPEWGWAWPANRRILYNRASADPDGKPWSERKRYVWWDEDEGEWTGYDVPDFEQTQAAVVPAAARAPRAPRASPATTRSSCRATARAGCTCRSGAGRRAAADALRAGRVAGAQPALRRSRPTRPARSTRTR